MEKWEGAVETTEVETTRSETLSVSGEDASSAVDEEMPEGDDASGASEAEGTEEEEGLTTDGSDNDDPWLPVRNRADQDRRPQLSAFALLMNQLTGWATPATGAYLHGRAFDPTQGASTVRFGFTPNCPSARRKSTALHSTPVSHSRGRRARDWIHVSRVYRRVRRGGARGGSWHLGARQGVRRQPDAHAAAGDARASRAHAPPDARPAPERHAGHLLLPRIAAASGACALPARPRPPSATLPAAVEAKWSLLNHM